VPDAAAAIVSVVKCKPVAIVTVDELPGLTGTSLVAALKSSPEYRSIPIVMATTRRDLNSDDFGQYKPDHLLHKTGKMRESLEGFLDSIGLGVRGVVGADEEPETMPKGTRVLLAEDNIVNQTVVGHVLHVAGAEVVAVGNGAEAVAAALRESFDLILMDLQMPVLDGYEATRILRSSGLQIPILALTGEEAEAFEENSGASGFDQALFKPVDRRELLDVCCHHLALARDRATAG
jgi:CheY-like chemotaxis protein